MKRFSWVLALCCACLACGGHSAAAVDPSLDDGAGTAGADAADPSASAGAGSVEAGGAAPSQPESGLAGAADEAGAPGYEPHIGSGARNCESSEYCFGLSCYAPPSFLPTVCVANCETDFDCGLNEVCVRSAKLAPTCYARCSVPGDCEYHFDCMDFSGAGQLLCFPSGWATRREELN